MWFLVCIMTSNKYLLYFCFFTVYYNIYFKYYYKEVKMFNKHILEWNFHRNSNIKEDQFYEWMVACLSTIFSKLIKTHWKDIHLYGSICVCLQRTSTLKNTDHLYCGRLLQKRPNKKRSSFRRMRKYVYRSNKLKICSDDLVNRSYKRMNKSFKRLRYWFSAVNNIDVVNPMNHPDHKNPTAQWHTAFSAISGSASDYCMLI